MLYGPLERSKGGTYLPYKPIMSLEQIYNANNLFNAFMKAKQGTDWKEMVQKYEANLLLNIFTTRRAISTNTYSAKPTYSFKLNERGHTRQIKAQNIYDRVVQRSFNDNVLVPKTRVKLIYDNGATLKDKGESFARKRFEIHLRKAYREYGDNACIILMDFTKYYDNVLHEVLISMYKDVLDSDELSFLADRLSDFRVDVSYMSDEEFKNYDKTVFNALTHSDIPAYLKTGQKMMPKSLDIGNQTSQISGVFYATPMDNYCKTVRRIKYYGRYMDDTYIIIHNKNVAKKLLNELKVICDKQGIFINSKKTHIYKITDWVTWLKINYKIKPTGGLVRKVHNKNIRRERRRLVKFRHLLDEGKMSYKHIELCYGSWKGTYWKYDSKTKLLRLDRLFNKLFKEEIKNGRK